MQPDSLIPNPSNPQAWNRFAYVLNNPINAADPNGHKCVGDPKECKDDNGRIINGSGGFSGSRNNEDNDIVKKRSDLKMDLGDIVTFEVSGEIYNYMLGLMDDDSKFGFWNLDTHTYVPYSLGEALIVSSDRFTLFKRTDPKTFNSYETAQNNGNPFSLPSYNVSWTGGLDDNPSYVKIHTNIDWYQMPGQAMYAIFGIGMTAAIWMNPIPATPQDNKGYFTLTVYISALNYFATDQYTINRTPIIHP